MKLIITEKAKKVFKDSTEDPYMRVGARPGGCSGWMFTLESDTDVDITDSMFDDMVIIDTELHENVIGDLKEHGCALRIWLNTLKQTQCLCMPRNKAWMEKSFAADWVIIVQPVERSFSRAQACFVLGRFVMLE